MEIVQYLENFNLISIILRMTLATLFGGLIGLTVQLMDSRQEFVHLPWYVWVHPWS